MSVECFSYSKPTATAAETLGWQANQHFIINENLQVTQTGQVIPLTAYETVILPSHLHSIPMPTVTAIDPAPVVNLYDLLEELLPPSTYMTAVLLGG